MIGRRRWSPLAVFLAAVMACALLVGAVSAGMRVPAQETLSGISAASALDYARFPARLSRLSSNFIAKALGFGGLDSIGTSSRGNRTSGSSAVDGAGRIVVKHALTNDHFEDAYVVPSIPFTALTNTSGATRQNEPNTCAPTGGTVWYRYRPQQDEGLVASTIGTKHATSLAVYTGSDRTGLAQVAHACHTSAPGSAYVTFAAKRSTTYYFQVTGIAGGGPSVFNLDPLGTTEIVSLSSEGKQGDSSSLFATISADGRYVAFTSGSTDLVDNDTNGVEDVFVRDLLTGRTERVSVDSQGKQGKQGARGESKPWQPAISADGRFVAFTSLDEDLVPGDSNLWEDVFLHDRVTHKTTRVSVSSSGQQGVRPIDPTSEALRAPSQQGDDLDSWGTVSISADGRFIAFDSELAGLVADDKLGDDTEAALAGYDVFVHDRITGRTTLASRSSRGDNGNALSVYPDISADGRYVAFVSSASNLVAGDDPAEPPVRAATIRDVFVHDLRTSRTERVSISDTGANPDGQSFPPSISADGRYVAFMSVANNLVGDEDRNPGIDVFVRDRSLGRTDLVSLNSDGEQQVAGESHERAFVNWPRPAMSFDGRYIAFHSDANNLVPGDTNGIDDQGSDPGAPACLVVREDVFVRDRLAATTTRVSVSSSGGEGNGASIYPSMSSDGRRITFYSAADNLVEGDRDSDVSGSCIKSGDVFLHTFPVLH